MPEPVRVLLTGRHGQLGQALLAAVPEGIAVIATGLGGAGSGPGGGLPLGGGAAPPRLGAQRRGLHRRGAGPRGRSLWRKQ